MHNRHRFLRLLVRKADRMTIATEELVVPASRTPDPMPPMFLPTNAEDWLVLRAAGKKGDDARRPERAIFLNTGRHDLPALEPTVRTAAKQPFLLLIPASAGPDSVSVRIVGELSEVITGGEVELLGRHTTVMGGKVIDGELRPGTLAPGRYRLQLRVGTEGGSWFDRLPSR